MLASSQSRPVSSPPADPLVLAFAEAIIPGSRHVPAADERTLRRTLEMIEHLSPLAVRAFRVAIATLDAAAVAWTGHRFHRLSRGEQDDLLGRWERDPRLRRPLFTISFAFKFAHFDRDEIYRKLGRELNLVTNLEQPRWLSQIHDAATWTGEMDHECDVVVIGTGAGGAVVGRELADRGFGVIYVEEGKHYRRDAFDGRSIDAHRRFYRGAMALGNAPMPVFVGRLVGGSTAINTGTCFRTPDWILERWCESLGTDEFSPENMRPIFERVESIIEVAPARPEVVGPPGQLMARGADHLGWSHFPAMRNAPSCDGKGFCDFGCRTDARRSTNLSYLPPALERGAMCFSQLRATRIVIEDGRAVGIEAETPDGRTMRVRARAVVLSGGAIPTPLFLQKQGIANSSGQVGRNLMLHPSTALQCLFDEEVRGAHYIPQGHGLAQFMEEGILIMSASPDVNYAPLIYPFTGSRMMEVLDQIDHLMGFSILTRDAGPGGRVWFDVGGNAALTYNLVPHDVALLHRGLVHAAELAFAAGAKRVYPSMQSHPVVEPNGLDRLRRASLTASDLLVTSYHPLGTCKMGKEPRTSVVDLDHETHDVRALFVVDGSTVPTALGVNPQVTIMAMATRAAAKIAAMLD